MRVEELRLIAQIYHLILLDMHQHVSLCCFRSKWHSADTCYSWDWNNPYPPDISRYD